MSTKGYLPHHVIKAVVFWVLSACTVFSTAAGILRSWETIGEEVASNCLWTAFILALGSIVFLLINCAFGDYGKMLIGQGEPSVQLDSSFSESLRKSKVKVLSEDRPGVDHLTNP